MVYEPVMYPTLHRWFVALAALDVLLTEVILTLGGIEINPLAASVHQAGAITAMAFFKFATVAVVLLSCEYVGRRSLITGRRIASCAVTLNCIAVGAGASQIALYSMGLIAIA